MGFWDRLFGRGDADPLAGRYFQTCCLLFSEDGKRKVEVRAFDNGKTYLLESEWVEGEIFEERHSGQMVGPFKSPAHAERFIVATAWFTGQGG